MQGNRECSMSTSVLLEPTSTIELALSSSFVLEIHMQRRRQAGRYNA